MSGKGLAKGLAVTFGNMMRRSTTQEYPDVQPELPARTRGVIALLEENCTVCMLCSRECPDWCIYIDSHKEEVLVPGAARARQRNVLDRFAIDFALCMYCGICVEVCPFDALHWSPEFEYSDLDVRDLLHERDRLGDWMATVPAPPAHDRNGEPSKTETAAAKKQAAAAGGAEAPARPAARRAPAAAAGGAEAPARPAARRAPAAAAGGADAPARPAARRAPAAKPPAADAAKPAQEPPAESAPEAPAKPSQTTAEQPPADGASERPSSER